MLFLIFHLGDDRYALNSREIVEVLPIVRVKSIPGAPPGVAGLINYHGASVPLIDLMELSTGRPTPRLMSTRIVLVKYSGGDNQYLGLLVRKATGIVRREDSDFAAAGVTAPNSPFLGPVTTDSAGIIQRVEVAKLLPEAIQDVLFSEK